jgi:hypothetical protein
VVIAVAAGDIASGPDRAYAFAVAVERTGCFPEPFSLTAVSLFQARTFTSKGAR